MFSNLKKYWRQLNESEWKLGICLKGYEGLKSQDIQWISNGKYRNKWFADPFILDYNSESIYLLVEEFDYSVHRGRIAKLRIDRNSWTVLDCKIILDLPTHLSFPFILRENGHIYVCPENYKSGSWSMYEYNPIDEKVTFIKEIHQRRFTDATLWKFRQKYYILSTEEPTPNGPTLNIFSSDTLMGEFKHVSKFVFNENIARNAGAVFEYNKELYRPAQECNYVYGHSIVFQKIELNDAGFNFKESYRFFSPNKKYAVGTHTFNTYGDLAVIDAKGYRYKVIGTMIAHLYNVTSRFGIKKRMKLI